MKKKYIVDYVCASTGYGWSKEVEHIQEVNDLIKDIKDGIMNKVTVFDRLLDDYVFYKDINIFNPKIDKLHNIYRDLRTINREWK